MADGKAKKTQIVPGPDGNSDGVSDGLSSSKDLSNAARSRRGDPGGTGGGRRGGGLGNVMMDLGEHADQKDLISSATALGRMRKRLGVWLESPAVELFVISLVCVYALLVCVMLVADEEIVAEPTLELALNVFDLMVNGIFVLEISLKSFAFGKPYYSDAFNVADVFLVVLSMALAILTISYDDDNVRKVLSFRGVLRLLRLIVIFRRVSDSTATLSQIKKSLVSGVDLSSPVEAVMETLAILQASKRVTRKMKQEVKWAAGVISDGNLYDVNLTDAMVDGRDVKMEASAWVAKDALGDTGGNGEVTFDFNVAAISKYTLALISAYGPEVQQMLEISELERWDYDMFQLDRLTKQNCLPLMTTRLFKSCGLWDEFIHSNETYELYISRVRDGYLSKPYHNAVHGADVVQTCFWFCNTGGVVRLIGAGATDFFCMLFAAIIHDIGHPGLNNVWHVKSNHPVAIRYNDKAVLEMMHISIAYSLCFEDENANIFKSLPRDKFDAIRASTILLVLATDMTQHFAKLGKLKARLQTCKDNQTQFPEAGKKEDKELLMENIIHACDISNPAQRTSAAAFCH
jgi:hypothetical protein